MTAEEPLITLDLRGPDGRVAAVAYVVSRSGTSDYLLTWLDGINRWEEPYQLLSHAVVRLGVLAEAVRQDRFFLTGDVDSSRSSIERFVEHQLAPQPNGQQHERTT